MKPLAFIAQLLFVLLISITLVEAKPQQSGQKPKFCTSQLQRCTSNAKTDRDNCQRNTPTSSTCNTDYQEDISNCQKDFNECKK